MEMKRKRREHERNMEGHKTKINRFERKLPEEAHKLKLNDMKTE